MTDRIKETIDYLTRFRAAIDKELDDMPDDEKYTKAGTSGLFKGTFGSFSKQGRQLRRTSLITAEMIKKLEDLWTEGKYV
ncbi:MAG: hypothetical protein IJU03_01005 [Thermoguttaceae bacterium]|nr:hypothetical protein [Thermoguttaceae bacterium]